jgi:hypothetical protein
MQNEVFCCAQPPPIIEVIRPHLEMLSVRNTKDKSSLFVLVRKVGIPQGRSAFTRGGLAVDTPVFLHFLNFVKHQNCVIEMQREL